VISSNQNLLFDTDCILKYNIELHSSFCVVPSF